MKSPDSSHSHARRCLLGTLAAAVWLGISLPPLAAESEVPAHNRPLCTGRATEAPCQTRAPARPPASDAEAKLRKVFDAIVRDDPALAADSFFPRTAFLLVKDMREPGRYYDRLRRRFDLDIHALHRAFAGIERAQFERFELAHRGGFVLPHEEANLLPYWAARHSALHFRIDGKALHSEVRVLISWDDHWYVIHLNEFKF